MTVMINSLSPSPHFEPKVKVKVDPILSLHLFTVELMTILLRSSFGFGQDDNHQYFVGLSSFHKHYHGRYKKPQILSNVNHVGDYLFCK